MEGDQWENSKPAAGHKGRGRPRQKPKERVGGGTGEMLKNGVTGALQRKK